MRSMVSTLLVTTFALYSNSATIDVETFRNCITPNMKPSQCTYLKSCEPLLALSQKQPQTEDDRVFLQRSECGFKEGRPLVCCPPQMTMIKQQPKPMWTKERSDPSIDGICTTPNKELGQCIYLESCEPLLSLIQKQPLPKDGRVHLQRSQCGVKEGRVLVCCPIPVTVTEQPPKPMWTKERGEPEIDGNCTTPNKELGQCIYLESCVPLLSLIQKQPLPKDDRVHLQRSQCGVKEGKVLVCCPAPVTVTEQQPKPMWTKERSKPEIDGNCTTPSKELGQCIYLESCVPLLSLIQKQPLPKDDKAHLQRSKCGVKEGRVLVCCPPPLTVTEQQTKPIGTQETCEPGNVLPQPGTCGSSYQLANRISGGEMTAIAEFPWVVFLQYFKPRNSEDGNLYCSGALINSRYVLTASHCVISKDFPAGWSLRSVRLGEWDTNSGKDCEKGVCSSPPREVAIEEHIMHEDYNIYSKNRLHDIALLRLSKSIPYSNWIKPICLPTAPHLRRKTFEGTNMDVVGWGLTENGIPSNIMLKARVRGVDLKKCSEVYKSAYINLYFTQLCAGGEIGIDSCPGDSGGPLMGLDESEREPYFYLAGIVSIGREPCGFKDWPSVYTRVGSYIDWIKNNIRP